MTEQMRKRYSAVLLTAVALGAGLVTARVTAAAGGVVALQGADIYVGDGRVVRGGTLVLRDGRIESIGTPKSPPAGVDVIDVRGLRIYPGLIDALGEEGQKKPDAKAVGPAQPIGGQRSRILAADLLDPDPGALSGWRESGILTVNVTPLRGVFRGQTVVVSAAPGGPPRIVRSPPALSVLLQGLGFRNRVPGMGEPGGEFPTRLIGVFGFVRQVFVDAERYESAKAVAALPKDADLDAMGAVVRGEMKVLLPGSEEREVQRVLDLARDYKLKAILVGGYEAASLAPELRARSIPVLISLDFPQRESDVHPQFYEPVEYQRYRVHAPKAASELQRAGVRIAFASDGVQSGREFLYNLRRTVREGLSSDAALRAATLSAAEILGVEKQLGSIEAGKNASLIVADGDLFDDRTQLRDVFVDGLRVTLATGAPRPNASSTIASKPGAGPLSPAPAPALNLNKATRELLIKNANVMTVTHGTLKGASILVRDGKIAAIGTTLTASPQAEVLDVAGSWITPGFIDCHSHIATDSHNESGANMTSLTAIYDVLNPNDIAVYRTLASGITTANTLHGSVNAIGGKTEVTKTRFGKPVPEFVFKGAKPGIKFASKEFLARRGVSPPSSWMGMDAFLREALTRARGYAQEWDDWKEAMPKAGQALLRVPPRRDLTLEPLVEAMRGERIVHVHSYTTQEMLLVMRVAEDFGFRVVIQHGTETYKIADELKRHNGGGASIFADLGAAGEMIGIYNAAILTQKGVRVSINSDGEELARYFNQYAARGLRIGLTEDQALALVTLNPAIQLQIDKQVGSIDVGKDADLVVFNKYPLSVYAVPQRVYIDGELYYSRDKEKERVTRSIAERARLGVLDQAEKQRFDAAMQGVNRER